MDALSAAPERWTLAVSFGQSAMAFIHMAEGRRLVVDQLERDLQVLVTTLQLEARAPWGTSLQATLPFGAIRLDDRFSSQAAVGLADVPLVLRQELAPWVPALQRAGVRVFLGVGVVAPTGEVVQPSDVRDDNLAKARELGLVNPQGGPLGTPVLAAEVFNLAASLGRGSWWMLGEAAVQWAPARWVALSAQVRAQGVIAKGRSGLDWGEEVFQQLGVAFRPGLDWLVLRAGLRHEWRAHTHEEMTLATGRSQRVRLDASGGHWLFATPGVALLHPGGAALSLGARLPLWRDVNGIQLVESWALEANLRLRFDL